MTPRNIRTKPWFNETISLDELIEKLSEIRDGLGGKSAKVVGVYNPVNPQEAEVISVVTRTEVLDAELGEHLNALSGQVTDIELEEATTDNQYELGRDGEVVYICLGVQASKATSQVYKL